MYCEMWSCSRGGRHRTSALTEITSTVCGLMQIFVLQLIWSRPARQVTDTRNNVCKTTATVSAYYIILYDTILYVLVTSERPVAALLPLAALHSQCPEREEREDSEEWEECASQELPEA